MNRYGQILLLLLVCLLGGCGKEGGVDRHLERALRFADEGDYAGAEIEFRNVLRDAPEKVEAHKGLGLIQLERGALLEAARHLNRASEADPGDVKLRIACARALAGLGFIMDARTHLKAVFELEPANGEALILLAETATKPVTRVETEQILEQVPGEKSARAWLAEAVLALAEGNRDAGETAVDRALALDPGLASAHLVKGRLTWSRGDGKSAEESFLAALERAPKRSLIPLNYVSFLMGSGREDEAVAVMDKIMRETPDFIPPWKIRAKMAFREGDLKRTRKALGKVFAASPYDFEANMLRAGVLLREGESLKAARVIGELRDIYPPSPEIDFQLARALLAHGDDVAASEVLEHALELKPDHVGAILLRAKLWLREGRSGDVIAAMRDLVRVQPENLEAWVMLVGAHRVAGDPAAAVPELEEGVAENGRDYRLHYLLGLTRRLLGDLPAARKAFEDAERLAPEKTACTAQLVAIDLAEGKIGPARLLVDARLAEQPDSAQLLVLEATVLMAEGKQVEAIKVLERVVELKPDFNAAYDLLIRLRLQEGEVDDAIDELVRLTERQPENTTALMQLAALQQRVGKTGDALRGYERLIEMKADFVPALNNLGVLYAESLDTLEKAHAMASKARVLQPEDPAIADTLGWVQYRRGEHGIALDLIREAATGLPDNPEVQAHLGMAAYAMGKADQAREAFAKVAASGADLGKLGAEVAERVAMLDSSPGAAADLTAGITAMQAQLATDADNPILRLRLAEAMAEAGRNDEAEAEFREIAKANPQLCAAHLGLAKLYVGPLKRPAEAIAPAERALKLEEGNPGALAVLGGAALRVGDYERAYGLLREAAAVDEPAEGVNGDLAWAGYSLGRLDEARENMQRELTAAGESLDRAREARLFLELTDPALVAGGKGEDRVAGVLEERPDFVPALFAAGAIAQAGGKREPAISAYRRVLAEYPGFAPAAKALAQLLIDDPASVNEAEKLALEARRTLDKDLELAGILARIYFQRGEYNYARQLLAEIAVSRELEPGELFFLGVSLVESGEVTRGRPLLEQALKAGIGQEQADRARTILDREQAD